MTSPLDTGNRWPTLGVLVFCLGCAGWISERTPTLALVNETSSVPRGLYLRTPGASPTLGDTVALPQPTEASPYLAGLGMPADVRLLKRISAVAGDRVCRSPDSVRLDGRQVPVRRRDRRGVRLPQWWDCRRLEAGEVFLLGDTPDSFDSRYFGPVSVTELDGIFREILTW